MKWGSSFSICWLHNAQAKALFRLLSQRFPEWGWVINFTSLLDKTFFVFVAFLFRPRWIVIFINFPFQWSRQLTWSKAFPLEYHLMRNYYKIIHLINRKSSTCHFELLKYSRCLMLIHFFRQTFNVSTCDTTMLMEPWIRKPSLNISWR